MLIVGGTNSSGTSRTSLGRRLVLDQLEHFGAQDDRARRDREVPADLELARVDRRGQPRRGRESHGKSPGAADQIAATRVDRLLETSGFDHGKFVGASASSTFPAASRARRSARQSTSRVGDQAVDRLADREVALQQTAKQPVRSHAGSAKRRSPFAGASCDRPRRRAGARPRGARCAHATFPGWRASPAPTLTADPGATNRGSPRRRLGQHHVQPGPRRLAGTPNA